MTAGFLLATWRGATALIVGFLDPATLRTSDIALAVLFVAALVGCGLAIARSARVGAWLIADPRWGWIVGAGMLGAHVLNVGGWIGGAAAYLVLSAIPVWGWLLIGYHALVHAAYWKKVFSYLVASEDDRLSHLLAPLVFTPIFYVLLHTYNAYAFDVVGYPDGFWLDLGLQIGIAYFLLSFCRNVPVVLLSQLLLMTIVYTGNAIKHSFLGGPIGPDDVASLKELVVILKGAKKILVVVPIASFVLVWGLNLRWRKVASPIAAGVLAVGLLVLFLAPGSILAPLDRAYGNYSWDQWKNYRIRGASVYFLQEYARRLATAAPIPTAEEVADAHARLRTSEPDDLAPPIRDPRNVYLIVLESFWDPEVLTAAELSEPPLAPAFLELWDAAGRSHALSPTAYGGTANAEYELLCGLPELTRTVYFQNGIRNRVPCLPALLAEAGYRTQAFHPNIPDFWNRKNIYARIGFDSYLSKKAFARDDLNGDLLSDASLFRQVAARLGAPRADRPRLAYILTITGHYDYPLNEDRRPTVIRSESGDRTVERYANSVRYTSAELAAFIGRIAHDDPTALVVATGDHVPFLGRNQATYRASGLFSESPSTYDAAMFHTLCATPLLVVDGRRGPVPVGDVPMYEIPALVFRLLAGEAPWTARYRPPTEARVRNFDDADLLIDEEGGNRLCRPDDPAPECEAVRSWKDALRTVTTDVMRGHQHTLY